LAYDAGERVATPAEPMPHDPPPVGSHCRLDRRSVALHAAIAEIIRRDPSAVQRALANLARWELTAPGPWIAEWRGWLLGEREALLNFLIERSPQADRLRQSSPFTGILSLHERKRILESHAA
jgi:hypothetical protein